MSEYREDLTAMRSKLSRLPSLTLLYQSGGLVAVSKPAGFSTEDVLGFLSAKLKTRITQVSRLDLPTSGVLLAAVGSTTSLQAWWLLAQFAGRLISKSYLCLCFGLAPAGAEREVSSPLLTTHSKSAGHGYSRTQAGPYMIRGCCALPHLCFVPRLHIRYLQPVCHQRLATRFWPRSQGSICSKKDWLTGLPESRAEQRVRSSARLAGVCLLQVWPVTGRSMKFAGARLHRRLLQPREPSALARRTHQIRAHLASVWSL